METMKTLTLDLQFCGTFHLEGVREYVHLTEIESAVFSCDIIKPQADLLVQ